MKTIWNGTLELGELAIPVGLASAVRDGGEKLRRIHRACKTPATSRSYCERHEQLLDPEDLVHAWEAAPGEYLLVEDDARAILEPVESRRIPISCFVDAAAISRLLVRKRYYLVPSTTIGQRAYILLAAAIADQDVAGLVRFTAWRSEQLGAITGHGGVLELATLSPVEDLVPIETEIILAEELVDAIDEELLELARELVDRHTRPLQPDDLASLERPRVRALLEQLLAGEQIVRADPVVQEDERPAASIDLEGTLRRSLKQAPRRRRRATATR